MSILKIRDKNGNVIEVPALKGNDGKSAYEYAKDGGYTGTEAEFIAKMSESIIPIESGGTGANNVADALVNLGLTATATELNYMDGVTSNVQTQLDNKANKSDVTTTTLTANRALVSNSSGKVAVSAVTSTELGYLDGVTSAVQTQLNNKAPAYTYGTAGKTAGSSSLTTGTLYFQYE